MEKFGFYDQLQGNLSLSRLEKLFDNQLHHGF